MATLDVRLKRINKVYNSNVSSIYIYHIPEKKENDAAFKHTNYIGCVCTSNAMCLVNTDQWAIIRICTVVCVVITDKYSWIVVILLIYNCFHQIHVFSELYCLNNVSYQSKEDRTTYIIYHFTDYRKARAGRAGASPSADGDGDAVSVGLDLSLGLALALGRLKPVPDAWGWAAAVLVVVLWLPMAVPVAVAVAVPGPGAALCLCLWLWLCHYAIVR